MNCNNNNTLTCCSHTNTLSIDRLYHDATIETFGRLLGLYGFQRIEQGKRFFML
jgi:hypothetical protein